VQIYLGHDNSDFWRFYFPRLVEAFESLGCTIRTSRKPQIFLDASGRIAGEIIYTFHPGRFIGNRVVAVPSTRLKLKVLESGASSCVVVPPGPHPRLFAGEKEVRRFSPVHSASRIVVTDETMLPLAFAALGRGLPVEVVDRALRFELPMLKTPSWEVCASLLLALWQAPPLLFTDMYLYSQQLSQRSFAQLPGGRVAVYTSGGLGDTIRLTDLVHKLAKALPGREIHAFAAAYAEDVFEGNPFVARARTLRGLSHSEAVEFLRREFDIVYEVRYVAKEWKRPGLVGIVDEDRWHREWEGWFDRFLEGNNALGNLGYHCLEVQSLSLGLDPKPSPELYVTEDFSSEFALPQKYIVVAPESDPTIKRVQTKCWAHSRWESLVKLLPLPAVQVGVGKFDKIKGAIDLRNKTTVRQLFWVVKNASLVVTIEGGVAHVAAATQTPAVVLFGPTPVSFFGYPQHFAVCANVCKPCWWLTPDWFTRCPRNRQNICMRSISVETVLRTVQNALSR